MKLRTHLLLILSLLCLVSCTFNPFTTKNRLTGSPLGTAVGAGAGAGAIALAGGSKTAIVLGGIGGAAIGYYVTSLRYASGGIIQGGGQVFTLGDYVTIDIPSDRLFDTNSADFLDSAPPILDSTVAVLKRYPNNNIIISGNTSGFGTAKFEHKLSEDRARQVSGYLWAHGVNNFKNQSLRMRKLTYVGYGNYFPVANNIRNDSIRQNSHIQITAYPGADELQINKRSKAFNNIGSYESDTSEPATQFGNEFSEIIHEQDVDYKDAFSEDNINNTIIPSSQSRTPRREPGNYKDESFSSAPKTTCGDNFEKQGGFNLKDEVPR